LNPDTFPLELALGILIVLLLASAFFSGAETALTRARRVRLRVLANQDNHGARLANRLLQHPERMLSAILLGNNFVNIAASSLTSVLMVAYFGDTGIIYATVLMTIVVLVFAEVLPKSIAVAHAEKIACKVAPILTAIMWLLAPLIYILTQFVHMIRRMMNMHKDEPEITQQDLAGLIDIGAETGVLDAAREQMLMNSLSLHEVPVKSLMTPRRQMSLMNAAWNIEECIQFALSQPHSRYPVFQGKRDHIIGMIHFRDLIACQKNTALAHSSCLQSPIYIPSSKNALKQLFDFQRERQHMSLIVDEYGDIEGLISLEDIIEEIVGEIADESDRPEEPDMWKQNDHSLLVLASANIHDINQALDDGELPVEGATSIGGLINERLGEQAEDPLCLSIANIRIEIQQLKNGQAQQIRLWKKPHQEEH